MAETDSSTGAENGQRDPNTEAAAKKRGRPSKYHPQWVSQCRIGNEGLNARQFRTRLDAISFLAELMGEVGKGTGFNEFSWLTGIRMQEGAPVASFNETQKITLMAELMLLIEHGYSPESVVDRARDLCQTKPNIKAAAAEIRA